MTMPSLIFAHIVGGFEDHVFGGCCWGTGEKYLRRYLPLAPEDHGSFYYSEQRVKELLNMDKAQALLELGKLN